MSDVWFVYDGACPICTMASRLWKVREAVGTLHLLDARENAGHPVIQEINARRINLDQGMVIKFNDVYYHGVDALHVMAMIGSDHDWFNRVNVALFRSRILSRISYPFMKAARRAALIFKGRKLIYNLQQ